MTKLNDLDEYFLESLKIMNEVQHTIVVPTKNPVWVEDMKTRCVGYVKVKPEDIDKGMDLTKIHYKISREMNKRLNIGRCTNIIFIPKGVLPKTKIMLGGFYEW